MKRNYKPNLIGEIIRQHVKSLGKEEEYIEAILFNHWEEIVGKKVFEQTLHINLNNRILYVKISSSVLRSELKLLRNDYKQKINDFITNYKIESLEIF